MTAAEQRCALCLWVIVSGEAEARLPWADRTKPGYAAQPIRTMDEALGYVAKGHQILHRAHGGLLGLLAETSVHATPVCAQHVGHILQQS